MLTDHILSWLPHALRTHGDELVRLHADALGDHLRRSDYRHVLMLWRQGPLTTAGWACGDGRKHQGVSESA